MALLHVDLYSDALCRGTQVDILLPECPAPEHGFPTLYLLHGMTDDNTIWQRRTSIERYADEKRIAVVMPDTRLAWYTNTAAGENYFDYIADELPALCRRMLPGLSRRREDSFVAGLSMGGYGAMKCALKRPHTFAKAVALSGALDLQAVPGLDLEKAAYWRDLFGPLDAIAGSENDLFRLAEECAGPRPELWIWCGTEDFLYAGNLRMRDHLRSLGYSLHYSESPGDHQWKYWNREIQNALNWLIPGEEAEICL